MQRFTDFLDQKGIAHATSDGLHVYGQLNLLNGNIELPDDMTVHGSLIAIMAVLSRLPKNLHVQDDLVLMGTSVTEVPDSLWVGGSMSLMRTSIESLPSGFRVPGNLEIQGQTFSALPEGLWIGGNLNISDTAIRGFPDMHVGGMIRPPGTLDDIAAFMHGQEDDVVLGAGSYHQRMHQRDELRGFPDLDRVVASLPAGGFLRLSHHLNGGYVPSYIKPSA